ncbi:helix-turn-helix transcriptional regulator [Streptomyces europaeiscabiei]|uniref:helix-turn-helix transcriptional regulator n=1 Tax=Streptomyces europaeiscabiei TaxID=146819 RepID=UPI0029A4C2AD|nr:helix-turn-helix transcriptional regulator [Streptomyces europaeiscabiei]MDX3634279.1 helix-turn-helix transcriptional regulator [Streptomyces europaeiscabiei]MDX3651873.1 helix-turn-helix transcriptional regulator [Streptomyces europaeiscabiei]
MDDDSKRLGSELQRARESRRPRLKQGDAGEALGVSRTTIQNIEHGKFTRINATVRKYARLLGWPEGAEDRVMAGGSVLDEGEGKTPASEASSSELGLSPEVEYELRTGETLGSQVINLGPDDEDGHIIVVLQGRKGATPEEVERIAARYRRARRHLQGLAAESGEVAET